DGILDTGDGILEPIGDIDTGDVLTFGPHFEVGTFGEAGTCDAPLDLADPTDRQRAQAFAIQGDPGTPTMMWVQEAGQVYRLDIALTGASIIGNTTLDLDLTLTPYTCPSTPGAAMEFTLQVQQDAFLNEFLYVDAIDGSRDAETTAGLWDWSDVESTADFGTDHPFTGKGWEGNYDSGFTSGNATFDNRVTMADPFCTSGPNCANPPKPVEATTMGANPATGTHEPALDSGDMIPFNWQVEQRDRFIHRLAPNQIATPGSVPEFRIAQYYQDTPVAAGSDFLVPLQTIGIRPLAAADQSPIAKAMNDFRCWYLGKEGRGAVGKCRQSAFYDEGWESLACQFDTEFGCRRPFFIVISDGEDNIGGEDPTSDVASLFSQSGVVTWAINLGNPTRCESGGDLHPITQAGRGECLTVATRAELVQTLKDIIGLIRETARSFASAAVPTVQATVDQKIFLSNFTPLNDESVWDGHIFGFLKPVPLVNGRPNTAARCDGTGNIAQREAECLLWDVGEQMQAQVATPALGLNNINARRVVYSQLSPSGLWPANRELFELAAGDCDISSGNRGRCEDLLEALGILPDPIPVDISAQEAQAIAVINETLALKNAVVDEVDPDTGADVTRPIEYILGDTFHSTPLVVGTPPSTFFFSTDKFTEMGDPTATCESGDNTGYRCFFRKHQLRRKVLLFGSNDGMVHAIDSGNYRTSGTDPITNKSLTEEFDNGTGNEIFGLMPRSVMSTVRELAEGTTQQFTVDGALVAGDVFIDPANDSGTFPDPDQREWRTVMVAGLREGGRGVYAIDVTQPDHLNNSFEPDDGGDYIPTCTSNYSVGACGPVPYPAQLWEFTDSVFDAVSGHIRLDEDANGQPDLGDTWSTPNIGLLEVCRAGGTACKPNDPDPANRADVESRFVAVFGGGMDVDSKTTPSGALGGLVANGSALRGNWIYMVDIETGQVLYKRQVVGAVASEIAAVDTDQNGALDRLYVPTIAGLLYRVDIGPDSSGDVPALDATPPNVLGMDGNMHAVPERIPTSSWQPRVFFDSLGPASALDATLARRPLYHRPSVFFIAKLGLYGLAFGSGDREDLWSISNAQGRFWVTVDDSNAASPARDESTLSAIDPIQADVGGDLLLDPGLAPGARGWYLTLNEKMVTPERAKESVITLSFSVRVKYHPRAPGAKPGSRRGSPPTSA
ncbi:MAG: PilC/PilY family type IV pilus protein, partial [Acidobacteriota bacterium]